VGAGLDLVFSDLVWSHEMTLTLDKFPDLKTITYDSRYEMNGRGLGFSVGILWKPHRMLQIGAKYQHRVVIDYRGFDIFDTRTPAAPLIPHPTLPRYYFYEFFNFFFKRQEVTSRLTLPQEVVGGVLIAPFPNLSLSFDAQRTAWHELGSWEFQSVNSDENLSPDFTPLYREFYGVGPNYGRQSAGLVLKDAWKYKGGIEYDLFGRFALRGGLARHESAVETSDLNPVYPDLDRTVMSLGFGYEGPFYSIWDRKEMGQFLVDVFFQYAWAKKRTASPPAVELTYEGNRWILGISVGFII
jgi:long-subunit fatty acid transport protein